MLSCKHPSYQPHNYPQMNIYQSKSRWECKKIGATSARGRRHLKTIPILSMDRNFIYTAKAKARVLNQSWGSLKVPGKQMIDWTRSIRLLTGLIFSIQAKRASTTSYKALTRWVRSSSLKVEESIHSIIKTKNMPVKQKRVISIFRRSWTQTSKV